MMRVLVLLFALFSMPVLAADYTPWPAAETCDGGELLAQAQGQTQGGQTQGTQSRNSGGSQTQSRPSTQSPRHPGDYCCKHCRFNETPCGNGCMAKSGNATCTAKSTCSCPGKP
jgi:hypothetical protein